MADSSSYIDSWKYSNIFNEQLKLNKKELNSYPIHWKEFINIIRELKSNTLLDVGCGAGAMSEVCRISLPDVRYTGMDYSESAIDIAKREWPQHKWIVLNYKELTEDFVKQFDTIHAGAFIDVLPNGDEALDFILGLGVTNVVIGRAKLTDRRSYFSTYRAYDSISTYAYHHNIEGLKQLADKHKYKLSFLGVKNQCNLIFQKNQCP